MSRQQVYNKVAIIGLGLIGGSFAAALKQRKLAKHIVGCARTTETMEQGLKEGLIDSSSFDPYEAVTGADLVFISVPVSKIAEILTSIKPGLTDSVVITDGGSVKQTVQQAARTILGEQASRFVAGHPVAGSEKSGVAAANPDLYEDHLVILTPDESTDEDAIESIQEIWQACGARVTSMDAEHHDKVLAATSHLPHLLAFALVETLARNEDSEEIFKYAAGGFRDFTRIASSDPVMWRDIFLENRIATLQELGRFQDTLDHFKELIEKSDGASLEGVLAHSKTARDRFSAILERKSFTDMKNTGEEELVFVSSPVTKLAGKLRIPGDKSISHRSIILGALAIGITEIDGFLEGEDALATLQAFRDMGVVIEGPDHGSVKVHGVGLHGLKTPESALYMGNSGTSMRLLIGLLSAQSFSATLDGDSSLSKRPMERVAKPLRLMGAAISTTEGGCPPVDISSVSTLKSMHYDLPVASAQVKSAILLAAMYAEGKTSVKEPALTRDHTERMLNGFGYTVETDGDVISLEGGGILTACKIDVPGDISSSAFFLVAASISQDADLVLEHVGINPTRIGVINILRLMGANIELRNKRDVGGEPVADIYVKPANLKGIDIPEDQVPLAIDEFPILFIAAACAKGVTRLRGAYELRVKESDRIQAMAEGLTILGIKTTVFDDGIDITGGKLGSGEVNSHDDHRIAMAFAVAGIRAKGPIRIRQCNNVKTSFPSFLALGRESGMNLEQE